MTQRIKRLFVALLAVAILGPALAAQEIERPAPECLDRDALEQFLKAVVSKALQREAVPQPLTSPSATQVAATSSASASSGIVDAAGFTELLSIALDNDLIERGENALTINLNLFAAKTLANPEVLDRQTLYGTRTNQRLRRLGGSISLGGKGESFDRDGDGEADEALDSDELSDIVTWEVKYRFKGSRDRRDPKNFARYLDRAGGFLRGGAPIFSDLMAKLGSKFRDRFDDTGTKLCVAKEELTAFFAEDDIHDLAREWAEIDQAARKAIEEVNGAVDGSLIWTLVLGGTEREEQFGPDKHSIGIRGVWGGDNRDFTINLDWSETEGVMGAADPTTLKLGLEYSTLWLKKRLGGEEGVKLSLSGSYETFDDVPAAKHDTIAKANAKLEIPISKGVKFPISVTWANHKDLLTDASEVRSHFGFTFDTSELLRKQEKD